MFCDRNSVAVRVTAPSAKNGIMYFPSVPGTAPSKLTHVSNAGFSLSAKLMLKDGSILIMLEIVLMILETLSKA